MFKYLRILLMIVLLLSMTYYKTVIYDFEKGEPFKGEEFYNPYQNISKEWIKSNFHAHSKLHFGLANGDNTPEEMFDKYDSLNYNLSCLSNYNSILPDNYNRDLYIPVYEHGRNFGTVHQLVIGASSVNNYDFLFFQNKSHKQSVINSQNKVGELISLAHPSFKNGYSKEDLRDLNNYDLFEGISPRASSIELWDEALSHGHSVWIIGNDDAHDDGISSTGVCWTMVNADDEQGVKEALHKGAVYATRGWLGQEMHELRSVSVDSCVYSLKLNRRADSIILKSDFGATVAIVTSADNISYNIKPENSYVRAEVYETEPWNNYTRTYINPVIRSGGGVLIKHNNRVTPNELKTWMFRGVLLFVHVLIIGFLFRKRLKRLSV